MMMTLAQAHALLPSSRLVGDVATEIEQIGRASCRERV